MNKSFLNFRSHHCHRYCGGSHTKIVPNLKKAPSEMIITSVDRHETNVTANGNVLLDIFY